MSRGETTTGGREATRSVIPGRFALSVGKPDLAEPPGFSWTKLSDLARIESGHTPSRGFAEYWDGPIPWVGIRDATGNHGRTIQRTAQSITELGLDNSSARLLPAGTVCLSRTASVGYVIKMGVPMATSQDFVNWICGPELSSAYLMYIFRAEQDSVRRFSHGTTHQTMYYPEAKALNILIPPRGVQDAIVDVLGALDDKIAANTKLADTSASLATAIFAEAVRTSSSEFVLSEITTLLSRGITPKYAEENDTMMVLNQKCVRGQRIDIEPARRTLLPKVREDKVLQLNDVLVNSTGQGTLGRVARWTTTNQATVDSHITIVRFDASRANPVTAGIGLLGLQDTIVEMGEGSTGQTELSRIELGKLRLKLPALEVQSALGRRFSSMAEMERTLFDENLTLAATRDALLPQFMSGKLRVKEAETVLEEAGV